MGYWEHGLNGLGTDLFACGDWIFGTRVYFGTRIKRIRHGFIRLRRWDLGTLIFLEHGSNGLDTDLFACGDGIYELRFFLEHGFNGLGTDFSILYHPKGCGARGNSANG